MKFHLRLTGAAALTALVWLPAGAAPAPRSSASTAAASMRPQAVIAIGNSESMDGVLSGAIMTGSGRLPDGLAGLYRSSSPQEYAVPAGFVPPLTPQRTASAPYTTSDARGMLYDNSASRLNIAKAGIAQVVSAFLPQVDFALVDYAAVDSGAYSTWVYLLPPGNSGFAFANVTEPGKRYVANPCFQFQSAATSPTLADNCRGFASGYGDGGAAQLNDNRYLQVSHSSDDTDINDVLYNAPGIPGVVDNLGQLQPPTPYPPDYTLQQYNKGKVSLTYSSSNPVGYALRLQVTNAGYIPYAAQALFVQRGFGYVVAPKPDTGTTVAPLTQGPATTQLAAFSAALAPETNDAGDSRTGEIKALAVQSPLAGLVAWGGSLLGKANGPCPGHELILVTDGLPTEDLSGDQWPPLGSAAAQGYGVHAGFFGIAGDPAYGIVDEGGKQPAGTVLGQFDLASSNDQAMNDTIVQIQKLQAQGIRTYVIGLGAGADASANPAAHAALNAMAIAGGTGAEYAADSVPAFYAAVKTIVGQLAQCFPAAPLGSVYFPYDRYVILPKYRDNQARIDAHVRFLQGNPQANAVLQGNCDARGSREYNIALGQKRAEIVMQAMEKQGIDAARLEAVSFGKERPKASGSSDAAYAENRRTDVVYPAAGASAPQGVPLD